VRQTFEIPLDIPDVTIENVTTNRIGHIEITVKSTVEGTPCHRCGKMTTQFYGEDREITLRHLPILGRKTFIRLRPKRYQCLHCHGNPTTTQQLSWYTPRSCFTKAYEKQILLSLVNSTVQDISIKEDIGYEAIMGIIDRHIERDINWEDVTRIDVIGLDEVSLKKGHRDFVAIITGRIETETVILGVLPDRKKATVKAFLSGIPQRLRQMIHFVCTDMYEGFVNAAKEVFGKRVKIVIDRFHVAKLYRRGLDRLRKHELKRLKQELSEEAYSQLKGAMWALRKAEEQLTDEDKDVLICLFEHSPCLKMAYELCNALTSIFDTQLSQREGKRQLWKWMQKVRASQLRCFDSFLTTLENWLDDIANYFINRHTSGFVEGFNNKLKVIKRRCYGILNVTHLFQRIQLDLYGHSLFALKIIEL
jgi:transposase